MPRLSSAPPMAPPDELERHRANSGEPVRSCTHTGQRWGWRSLGDPALAVWTRRDEGYLIEFFDRCRNAASASSITISRRELRDADRTVREATEPGQPQ